MSGDKSQNSETPETSESLEFPSTYAYTGITTLVGCIAVLLMTIASFIFDPAVFLLDQTQDIAAFTSTATMYRTEALILLVLDSIFIVGYTALFGGLWLLVRDFSDIMSTIALLLGLLVTVGDILENAIQIVLIHGITSGWEPEPMVFAWVWILNILIDLTSYIVAIMFAIIHLRVWTPVTRKFMLGILLVCYAIIGLLSLIFPYLLFVRSIFFVIGLAVGAYVLLTEEDLKLEELEELLYDNKKKHHTDYIR